MKGLPAFVPLLASLLLACNGSTRDQPVESRAGADAQQRTLDPIPGLTEVKLDLEEQPWGLVSLALSPTGTLAYLFGQGGPPYLTVVAASGRVEERVGQEGEGPGELSGAGTVWYDDGSFVVVDSRRGAVVRFAVTDGAYLGERRYQSNAVPLAVHADSLDNFDPGYALRRAPAQVSRVSLRDGGSRAVIDGTDPVFQGDLRPVDPQSQFRPPPPYFSDGGVTMWADPHSYQIRLVRQGSMDTITVHRELLPNRRGPLSERLQRAVLEQSATKRQRLPSGKTFADNSAKERLDTLDREVLPYILWRGLGIDGSGRIVAVGMSDDSVFVDFFRDSTFLGREMIDCFTPSAVAVGHDRVALHCRGRTDESTYQLKEWAYR